MGRKYIATETTYYYKEGDILEIKEIRDTFVRLEQTYNIAELTDEEGNVVRAIEDNIKMDAGDFLNTTKEISDAEEILNKLIANDYSNEDDGDFINVGITYRKDNDEIDEVKMEGQFSFGGTTFTKEEYEILLKLKEEKNEK